MTLGGALLRVGLGIAMLYVFSMIALLLWLFTAGMVALGGGVFSGLLLAGGSVILCWFLGHVFLKKTERP